MENLDKEVVISINTSWSGGFGRREHVVTYSTAQLMLQADYIRANNQTYKVKDKQVDLNGYIDFFVIEVKENEM